MRKLTEVKIRSAKPAASGTSLLSDGEALFLEVRKTGAKFWRYRFRLFGKPKIFTIGRYYDHAKHIDGELVPPDHISLERARIERDKARALVRQGRNPTTERDGAALVHRTEQASNFEVVARQWLSQRQQNKTTNQVRKALEADVFPAIGPLALVDVKPIHVLKIMRTVEERGAKTVAHNIHTYCSGVFNYAVANTLIEENALVGGVLRGAIKRDPIKHKTPLSREEIPVFLEKARARAGKSGFALRLLLLTFVRPVEMRTAEWLHFDLDHAEWRIPGEKMKMGQMHIIPLSTQAVALLREIHAITGKGRYVFPNLNKATSGCMSEATLNVALSSMGYKGRFSAHGFRATASTFLNELGYRSDLIERQLAHQERDEVRASYNQAQYLPERREMMQAWADFIDNSRSKNVISITGRAA